MAQVQRVREASRLARFAALSLLAVACDSGPADKLGGGGAAGTSGGEAAGAAGSTHGSSGVVIPPVAREDIGKNVFNEDEIQSYYLTFADDEYERLMDLSTLLIEQWLVNEDRYVEAALRVGDTELPSIGVRFKGDYSLWGCVDAGTGERMVRVESIFGDIDVCQRFSLKLDFDRYEDGFRLDGLKKLNLHAMSADPSKVRERLAYSLFRDMDIVAPRAAYARVYINGEYHGLFTAVEQVDGRFTANRFPASGDGNLYKEIWPAEHLTSASAEEHLKTNEEPDILDVSDLLAFKDAVMGSTGANFATRMAPYVDLDYLARYIVIDRAINNFDGIMAFYGGWGPPHANHNYYWYHDTESGQFTLIPWDFDKAFWYREPNFWSDNAANGANIVPNWNVITNSCDAYPVAFDALGASYEMMEIDCDPFLDLLRGEVYASQQAITDTFIAGPFSEQSVTAKVEAWRTQIASAIEDDLLVDSSHWQESVDELLADLPNFHTNVSLMMSGLIEE